MKAFLQQVAAHYFAEDISGTVFIFPNRRSMAFFSKYLSAEVAARGTAPLVAPRMMTVNDFFYHIYDADVTDRISLILELYEVYSRLNPKAEPLDEFVFWGDVILSDFDDVDKYLVDADGLFRNIEDLKEIQDEYSYLTENQREAIEKFISHFRDRSGRLAADAAAGENVKGRFLHIWNLMSPMYKEYRKCLKDKGLSYEGMVYRDLAERLKSGDSVADVLKPSFPDSTRFVFVGLNALNECEKTVLARMRDATLAEFVWDYVGDMVRHPLNKSSFFMKDNVKAFPQAFELEKVGTPEVHVVSVPSSVGQAKLAPKILSECVPGDPVETAFVLPDENLLLPLLNSLPEEVDSVNVTMGCPMKSGALYVLMDNIIQLQLRLREKDGKWYFYYRPLRAIFSSSIFRTLLSEEEKKIVRKIVSDAGYYVPCDALRGGELLDRIFTPVITSQEVSPEMNSALCEYLSAIVSYLGWRLRSKEDMLLELDYAKRYHMVLNVLGGVDVNVTPRTWISLLDSLLDGVSVPFNGEPLQGLQIMGPLETRALDFRNLVIFSANEGVFPRRSVSSSFIPPELRKGFGLPTYEYQDAVWAYYFYRLIQRSEKVWLVYDSRTEGMKSGEESRYIKQLQYHFNLPLIRETDAAELHEAPAQPPIQKTREDIDKIRSGLLSASSLQSYLSCPAKFYYQWVKRLEAEDEVAESMDAGMIGNVFHKTMQELYSRAGLITGDDIQAMMDDKEGLKKIVRGKILEEMHSFEVSGRNLVLEEIILDYVSRALAHDKHLLDESGSGGFEIFGLEKHLYCDFEGFHFHGFLDRIDSYIPGKVRILDYKTGNVEDNDIDIRDENAADVVDKLFGPSNVGRPKIALQLFLYGLLAETLPELKGKDFVNSICSTRRLFAKPLKDCAQSPLFVSLVKERLKEMLAEMVDPDVPFSRTDEPKTCEYCDFKTICGR